MSFYMEENLDVPVRQLLELMQRRIMTESTYFGVQTYKSPVDYWVYQEIIFETKPDVILEIGNHKGGSTLALAHICDLIGRGRVIGVDLSHLDVPRQVRDHPRITLVEGDACRSFKRVKSLIRENERVLIIEDSSHTYDNTLYILRAYSSLIKPGDYFIVEDGICHHGLSEGPRPGPYEAVETFVLENGDFVLDRTRESFGITWNPKGYLERTSGAHDLSTRHRPAPLRWEHMKRFVKLFIPPVLLTLFRRIRG
jgi:cephalosporin hydroxylase